LFKNLTVYRIGPTWSASLDQVAASLEGARFVPPGLTEPMSAGWVAPRGDGHLALAENVGGQWLLRLMIEQRVLPGAVVKRRTAERAQAIEQETGRKPGRKQTKEIKEQVVLELLPLAFTKQATVNVWIDPKQRLLMIDAGSPTRAGQVITQLVKALADFSVAPLQTAQSPAAVMSDWLASGDPPAAFSVDRDCELKASDESKAVVRYARHPLDPDEVRRHLVAGKQPTRLALTWQGRVSFVLTDALQIKKLDFLEGVVDMARAEHQDEAFDADAAIGTGELQRLIPELVEALGGELEIA